MEREEADDEDVPLAVLKRQGQLRMDEVERAREQQSEDVGACVQISSRMFRNDDRFMVLEQVDPEGKVTLAWSRALQPGRGLVYFVSSMHLRPAVYVVNQAGVGGVDVCPHSAFSVTMRFIVYVYPSFYISRVVLVSQVNVSARCGTQGQA